MAGVVAQTVADNLFHVLLRNKCGKSNSVPLSCLKELHARMIQHNGPGWTMVLPALFDCEKDVQQALLKDPNLGETETVRVQKEVLPHHKGTLWLETDGGTALWVGHTSDRILCDLDGSGEEILKKKIRPKKKTQVSISSIQKQIQAMEAHVADLKASHRRSEEAMMAYALERQTVSAKIADLEKATHATKLILESD